MEIHQLIDKAVEESVNELDSALQALRLDDNVSSTSEETVLVEEQGAVTELVDLVVRQITRATSLDDVKSCVANMLESYEKSRATEKAQKEKVLMRENVILKQAVAIQYTRQKEYEKKQEDYDMLKRSVVQYQEHIKNLEMTNYALAMHLRQAQPYNVVPARGFQPDVF